MTAVKLVCRALVSPVIAKGCNRIGLGSLPKAAAIRLDRITLNNWMDRMASETTIHYYSVAPALHLLMKDLFHNEYSLRKDHVYSVMSSRTIHLMFLSEYTAEILTATDDFKEKGRIIAVSRPMAPIAGFNRIETGQPYRNDPEPERIAHVAMCMVDKQGKYLPAASRNETMKKWLTFFGLDVKDSVDSFEFRGIKFTGIRKDMFGGRLTAIKFNIFYCGQSYQVEIRVDPVQETLASRQENVIAEVNNVTA